MAKCHKWFDDRLEDAQDRAVVEQDWDMVEFYQDLFDLASKHDMDVVERALDRLQQGANHRICMCQGG